MTIEISEETLVELQAIGYDSLEEYLDDLADEHGVSKEQVYALYSVLGQEEIFDGLVSSVEDIVEE